MVNPILSPPFPESRGLGDLTRLEIHGVMVKKPYLDGKAHLSTIPLTAILAFRQSIIHQAPSVFYADQCGMRAFLLPGARARGRMQKAQ